MADTIPNEGGVVAWFSGDNSVASFAEDLMPLGEGLSDFSNEVESIKPKAMNAAAEAARNSNRTVLSQNSVSAVASTTDTDDLPF